MPQAAVDSGPHAPPDYAVRPLQADDYARGYLDVLAELTSIGTVSQADFVKRLDEMDRSLYKLVVVVDTRTDRIVGVGSLLVELKFIHGCGRVGHIEDIVVRREARGRNLGKLLIDELVRLGREAGCYKIILDCAEKNVPFYEKCGFALKELQMALYFNKC